MRSTRDSLPPLAHSPLNAVIMDAMVEAYLVSVIFTDTGERSRERPESQHVLTVVTSSPGRALAILIWLMTSARPECILELLLGNPLTHNKLQRGKQELLVITTRDGSKFLFIMYILLLVELSYPPASLKPKNPTGKKKPGKSAGGGWSGTDSKCQAPNTPSK